MDSSGHNKETYKLLHLSDNSQSLSDLELPEVIIQRKRKVRRKTRSRTIPAHRNDKLLNNDNQCNRNTLIVWIAIFLTCCWLLTLSYMIAVIHSENLRLEVQLRKFSVTSQNLPEALQKWHETSRNLEQKQIIITDKISEIQRSQENFNAELTQLKTKFNEKKDYTKDVKYVAEFGAKIVGFSADVELMREEFSAYKKNQNIFKNDLLQLKNNFSSISTDIANNTGSNCTANINSLEEHLTDKIKFLTSNLSIINDTLSQKSQNLNDQVVAHKKHLDELFDTSANTTSHVASIENDWTKHKDIVVKWNSDRESLFSEIGVLKNTSAYLGSSINDVRTNCNKFQSEMMKNIEAMKDNYINKINSQAMFIAADANTNLKPELTTNSNNNSMDKLNDALNMR